MSKEDSDTFSIPLKVYDASRRLRKGIVTTSIEHLYEMCKEKFGYESGSNISIVIDDDGTQVDDTNFLKTLRPHSIVMVLKNDESWTAPISLGTDHSSTSLTPVGNVPNAQVLGLIEKIQSQKRKSETQHAGKGKSPDIIYRILCGWMHFSYTESRYIKKKCTKTAPSGGTISLSFKREQTYAEALKILQDQFFPKGKNSTGRLSAMISKLGNSKGEEIQDNEFTIHKYYHSTQTQRVRLYLLTKAKLFELDCSDSEVEDFDLPDLPDLSNAHQSNSWGSVSTHTNTPNSANRNNLPASSAVTFQNPQERRCQICFDRDLNAFFFTLRPYMLYGLWRSNAHKRAMLPPMQRLH